MFDMLIKGGKIIDGSGADGPGTGNGVGRGNQLIAGGQRQNRFLGIGMEMLQ